MSFFGQILRHLELALSNVLIERLDIIIEVGGNTDEHLIQHHADLVDVCLLGDPGPR